MAAETLPAGDPYYASPEVPCHCPVSTPWAKRQYCGTWEEGRLESRTCRTCKATLSRVVA